MDQILVFFILNQCTFSAPKKFMFIETRILLKKINISVGLVNHYLVTYS